MLWKNANQPSGKKKAPHQHRKKQLQTDYLFKSTAKSEYTFMLPDITRGLEMKIHHSAYITSS
ncbi:hypothetical protein [Gimesia aquarii]|uniref:Uncharacterized protein n=1 Tax=Gimesia aquarii TaxID=2527964 RepID=A0A517W4K9_9PLAN|nr:hypothetical protein [Gimesia aquarii]QDU00193.1 hypothetical protein V144x_57060 [Gimesia aquarii]